MELTRRALIQGGLAAGAVGAVSGWAPGSLSEAAVAATGSARWTTLARTFGRGVPGRGGYTPVVVRAGEPHVVRTELGATAGARRARTRTPVLSFAQLSDVHVVDHESPMRVEWADRYDDPGDLPTPGLFSAAYRPQEMLTAQVADAMVRAINRVGSGPVTGQPLAFALQTGDNTDNCQHNEVRWNIDVLDGGRIVPDSGDRTRYEGVMESDPLYWDRSYWHPEGTPAGHTDDIPRASYGFPVVPGLLDAARRPFDAEGLAMAWYTAFGNHDGLVQGNFPDDTTHFSTIATGPLKLISPPAGVGQNNAADTIADPAKLQDLVNLSAKPVTPDPDRRHASRAQTVEEHFHTTGLPVGHGYTEANRADGTAYYAFDQGSNGAVRCVVLDTVNPNGYADGSLDATQFAWLQGELAAAADRLVVVFSHHTSDTMGNAFVATGGDPSPRVLGDQVLALLLASPQVIAWVNGHTHRNQIWARPRSDGSGGLWEINTASHCDWPQQSRLLEVADNHDGTLSIFTTMVDHAGPASYGGDLGSSVPLASLSRELSANDWQERTSGREGKVEDRNAELLLPTPPGYRG